MNERPSQDVLAWRLMEQELQKLQSAPPPAAWECSSCHTVCATSTHDNGVVGGHIRIGEKGEWICPQTNAVAGLIPKK